MESQERDDVVGIPPDFWGRMCFASNCLQCDDRVIADSRTISWLSLARHYVNVAIHDDRGERCE